MVRCRPRRERHQTLFQQDQCCCPSSPQPCHRGQYHRRSAGWRPCLDCDQIQPSSAGCRHKQRLPFGRKVSSATTRENFSTTRLMYALTTVLFWRTARSTASFREIRISIGFVAADKAPGPTTPGRRKRVRVAENISLNAVKR